MISRNIPLAKKMNAGAIVISVIVLILVLMMRRVKIDVGIDFGFLPAVHSTFNAMAAVALLMAIRAIKNRNAHQHRFYMMVAMVLSILFLTSYVVYHFTMPETAYCKEGLIRTVYFVLLVSHIILAAVILPFILFTFIRAFTAQFDRHKTMARWVFPLWLFVAVSGPVLYLMLRDCYPG